MNNNVLFSLDLNLESSVTKLNLICCFLFVCVRQDEQLKEVIEKGREMEEAFSHLFDYILVNMDLDRSYEELLQEINRIETEPQWVPIAWVNNYMWARENLSGYPLPGWTTTCEQGRTSVGTHCLGEPLHVSKGEPQWVPIAWVNHYLWARENLSGYPLPEWTTTCEQGRTSVGTHCLSEPLHVGKGEPQWVPVAWVNHYMWARENLSGYPLPGWTTTCEQGRTSVGTHCLGEPLHVSKGEPQWVPIAWVNHYMWARENLSGYPLPGWTTTWEQVVC